MNPIIFKDDNGVGVLIGEEKAYLTEEISIAMGSDFAKVEKELDLAQRHMDSLKAEVLELKHENEMLRLKMRIIVGALGDVDEI